MSQRRSRAPSAVIDPDVDPDRGRRGWDRHRFLLPVIALGGMAGASLRHLAETTWPTTAHDLPWATWGVNVSGCLLIGVLMVLVIEMGGGHPLLRPFVGVGLLGGFTTFSTYTVQVTALLHDGRTAWALGYLLGTAATALAAVVIGVVLTRAAVRIRRRTVARRGVT